MDSISSDFSCAKRSKAQSIGVSLLGFASVAALGISALLVKMMWDAGQVYALVLVLLLVFCAAFAGLLYATLRLQCMQLHVCFLDTSLICYESRWGRAVARRVVELPEQPVLRVTVSGELVVGSDYSARALRDHMALLTSSGESAAQPLLVTTEADVMEQFITALQQRYPALRVERATPPDEGCQTIYHYDLGN